MTDVTRIPALPPKDPRIEDALRAAKGRAELRGQRETAAVLAEAIKSLPDAQDHVARMRQQRTEAPSAPGPTPDEQADAATVWLNATLTRWRFEFEHVLADKKVSVGEVLALLPVIAKSVAEGAPLLRGETARALVIATFSYFWNTEVVKRLPPLKVGPISIPAALYAPVAYRLAVQGLETAYQRLIKR
ncbi:hypothetical protein [Deinococcus fonticola]|uniref:hypothetical protein n=1 Tax=Deinococcus fonticola TaxID=2528713 RepID=UPI0010753EB5|nr:hypothetical protein [Deinococcus fonticola]